METDVHRSSSTDDLKIIPSYVLDDLSSRFIINSRPEEIVSIIRIFFLIENAYWFYLDFHRVENTQLKECSLKEFAYSLINHCPQLKHYAAEFDKHFEDWKHYKRTIRTCGAIILDPELKHVLLVQSFSSKNSWGFPKGKINLNEPPEDCAAREVLEETGFDIKPYMDPEEYLEKCSNEQVSRLYIVANVPLNSTFTPKTRREIRDIQWFPMDTLPTHRGDQTLKETVGQSFNLYTITPFLKPLRIWIKNKFLEASSGSSRQRNRQKQQKQFSQQNYTQYQEFMQLKKGKSTAKSPVGQRSYTAGVRYSRDISDQETNVKQGRRGKTVVQSLFGNKDTAPVLEFKAPIVDTNSFYSKTWYNFTVNEEQLMAFFPHEGTYFLPSHFSQQKELVGK
ncbi:m7GpppN-mRNA hydrolase [Biomphalaria glabrata]|uniref:mRNA-decapping enzyme 2 n=1 Tax=Biomphalaria glabrata TaxID=6526 RepID=A0A2C9LXW2_BIOGL|nr:m7GpppN-mRNA hydrolase-like [Biomphalaria glabrata]